MGAFMPFFFTQFLQAKPAQIPALCVAVVVGLGATLLLRSVVFAERPERTLRRLVDAFRARAHEMVLRVDDVLAATQEAADGGSTPGLSAGGEHEQVGETVLERLYRARRRLNETALLVEDQLERTPAARVWPGLENELLALRIVDAELGLERLGVAVRRLARTGAPGGEDADQRATPLALTALRTGLVHLGRALERTRAAPRGSSPSCPTPAARSPASSRTPVAGTSGCSARRSRSAGSPTPSSTPSATPRPGRASR